MQNSKEATSLINDYVYPFFNACTKTTTRKAMSLGGLGAILWVLRSTFRSAAKIEDVRSRKKQNRKKSKGEVDRLFLKKLIELMNIVIPSWKSKEMGLITVLTSLLFIRTFLSIYIASVNGSIVKAIVKVNFGVFVKKILTLGLLALPASLVNSLLDYLRRRLALCYRERLTHYIQDRYIDKMNYYKITNLDSRISTPDQRVTQDIEKWAFAFSSLYTDFSKPLLDIILFSRKLSELVGWTGPIMLFSWYFISGIIIRFVSPPFGKLTAVQQRLEGEFRQCHNDLINHSEEIAFYRGSEWEKTKTDNSFKKLVNHILGILKMKIFMGTFDGMLVKYGAVVTGYAIVGLPVFGRDRAAYLKQTGGDASIITRDYIRNTSLLINLAKATGRFIVSYKTIQSLAGFTSLISEMIEVLEDLPHNRYTRTMIKDSSIEIDPNHNIQKGQLVESRNLAMQGVPIITPNGDTIISDISFYLRPGMHCIVVGPNGCGKSSLIRILGELWPLFGGKMEKPKDQEVLYIPQRYYHPVGTLRDQIIYPDSLEDMQKKGITDEDLVQILRIVRLDYLVEREKEGFETVNDWQDVLSGGEKQRMGMSRLFYRRPTYAVLDDCTSQVSMDVEGVIYQHAQNIGVTLLTVSHRQSLWHYHQFILRFDGDGGYVFGALNVQEEIDRMAANPAEAPQQPAEVNDPEIKE